MKSPIIWLPTLLLAGAILAVATSAPATPATPAQAKELQQLHQDLKTLTDRLQHLESAAPNIIPRGLASSTPQSQTPLGAA